MFNICLALCRFPIVDVAVVNAVALVVAVFLAATAHHHTAALAVTGC